MNKGLYACFATWLIVLAAVASRPQASARPQTPAPSRPAAPSAPLPSAAAAPARTTPAVPAQQVGGLGTARLAATTASHEPLLKQYCITCHNDRAKTGGLTLDGVSLSNIPADAVAWEKVIKKVRAGMMPPTGMPRPTQAALDDFVAHLETTIDKAAFVAPALRRATLHRLNRAEYGNAVRDLLGVEFDTASLLPPDDEAYGFDNNAVVLNVSTSLMERYLAAAWRVSSVAVASTKITPSLETFRVRGDLSQHDHVEGLPSGTRGGIAITHYFPADAEYVISPRLYRETVNIIRGLELPHQLEVTIDGARVRLAEFGGPKDEQANYLQPTLAGDQMEKRFQVRMPLTAGTHTITVAFIKKSSATTLELLEPFDRERLDPITPVGIPELDKVTLEGPFTPTPSASSPSRKKIFTCQPTSDRDATACATTILTSLARRAYRGTLDEVEAKRVMGFYDTERADGGSFDDGVEAGLRFILVNPRFVFRTERDPTGVAAGSVYTISDLELASRLSFFLWSSVPDDTLLSLASQGKLRSPLVLEQQVRRMLRDPRARALATNFAGQWLYLRNVKGHSPDADVFPDFDHNLREALQRETEMLFESVVQDDQSVTTLLSADYTFVNERLAKHYGMPGIYGMQFRRVPVTDDARKGLLGHGSILALTSQNNRTSPVLRGKYVLTNILGVPPPPPPDNVPPLDETPGKALTMRARMEEHRRNPACSGCHKLMDPIGLALENFDGIGQWRTADNGAAIDANSQLADGSAVSGPATLREAILKRPELFARNVTEMLLTYALGHGVDHTDQPFIRAILKDAARSNYRFSSLIVGIVKSAPFQKRRAES
jgi:mono/diheme cytochrome c family protein